MLDKLFKWAQGRTTAFTLGFFVTGNVLQWVHRLDTTYIAFMGALLGAIIGHSYKDDKHDQAMAAMPAGGSDANGK